MQFDLRFYIVALVFLIFDVEVALFYPWAVAFGDAYRLAGELGIDPFRIRLVALSGVGAAVLTSALLFVVYGGR